MHHISRYCEPNRFKENRSQIKKWLDCPLTVEDTKKMANASMGFLNKRGIHWVLIVSAFKTIVIEA